MFRSHTARSGPGAILLLGLLAIALLVTGCGGSTAASPSPSPSPSTSSLVQKLGAVKDYVSQVTPIYNETTAALGSLDAAVSSLSKQPDQTWTDSAAQMTTASTALGTAATDLAALTPPASLQGAQDDVVSALQEAQKVLDKTSAYLTKRVADPNYPDIKTQITQQVTDALATAWASILNAAGQ